MHADIIETFIDNIYEVVCLKLENFKSILFVYILQGDIIMYYHTSIILIRSIYMNSFLTSCL